MDRVRVVQGHRGDQVLLRALAFPELARSLRFIAREGANYFYKGELADAMVAAVQGSAIAPGTAHRRRFGEKRGREW